MYVANVNRKWETLSRDPAEAVRLAEQRQGELLVAAANPPSNNEPLTLAKAFERWLQDVVDSGAHQDTIDAKTRISEQFQAHCKDITLLSELTRSYCLTWVNTALVEQGNGDRTRNVKANRLNQFLKFHRVVDSHGDPLLKRTDIPDYCEGEVQEFSGEELAKFWAVCRPAMKLMCRVLLTCGLRRQEIASLRWADINFKAGTLSIQPRPEYGFIPKKKHCRVVTIPDVILAELKSAKESSKSPLCFPTRNGFPNPKIYEFVSRTCKKAGIEKGKSHPHVFRSSYATALARSRMQIQDVAKLLGHKRIETTQRYMACVSNQELRQQVNQVRFAL
jgi:integrase